MLNSYIEELGPTGSSATRSRRMVIFRYVILFSLPSPDFSFGQLRFTASSSASRGRPFLLFVIIFEV
jgi:hypothetical protein